ncbi:MAG: hypothetical protein AB7S26_23660 [Sandaracinaceae bacterium]
MTNDKPVTVICKYVVKPGKEAEMRALLADHYPTLRRAGLVTEEPALIYSGVPGDDEKEERHGRSTGVFIEIFSWRTGDSSRVAHESPDVMKVWEPMGAICEHMEFPHFERITP